MQWDLPEGVSVEEIATRMVSLLAVEFSADRVLILYDDQGNHEYQVLASRKLDAHRVWTGEEVNLELLRNTVQTSSLQVGQVDSRYALCCPLVKEDRTVMIAYADRPVAEEEFSPEEITRILEFAELAVTRLPDSRPTPPPPVIAEVKDYRPSGRSLTGQALVAGRFAILEPLMTCRFSTLLYGLDRAHQLPVVLRRLEADSSDRDARMQMLREGRYLSRLQHRNLPRVQEIVEDRGQVYLVLEEFEGKLLEDVAREHSDGLNGDILRRYLDQFLDVLEFLHGQDPPLIHRDLRPDSLLVTPHGVLKLAEFGLARMVDSAASAPDGRQTAFRSQGNPYYAAPEQLLGEPSQAHHDLYSVGAILWRLATSSQPPKAVERMMGATVEEPLSQRRPELDLVLSGVIDRLMGPEAERRFASVAQVREALQEEVLEMEAAWVEAPVEASEVQAVVEEVSSERPSPSVQPPSPVPARRTARPSGDSRPAAKKLLDKFNVWNFLLGKKKAPPSLDIPDENDDIVEFHSDLMSGEEVDLTQIMLSLDMAQVLPETVVRSIQGVAYQIDGEMQLWVACKDPTEVHIYDHVSLATQGRYRPKFMRARPGQVDLAMEYLYKRGTTEAPTPWDEWLERKSFETEELQVANPMADVAYGMDEITSPIIAAVDRLVKEAISVGASDIHMETYATGLDLRYRIDGQLHHIERFGSLEASAMVKRLKVMANMDIAQERITQGGRISLKIGGQEFDLRVSVVPVPAGESVVMRILKKGAFNLTLSDLGFQPATLESYSRALSQPYGMILVCGPTGSGKSTTLYASLKQIQRPDRKLLTVEDPIEYQMPGICQVQTNNAPREEEKKVTFAKVLREFLRQDPDVILVGEIRDTETAAIAVQAALTGHLLLSTIHTNDSVGIVNRLMDMSVEPFLIGSTLLGGLAQRLARKICGECREEIEVTAELHEIFENEGIVLPPRMFQGKGCKRCHGTGYRGRMGLYELMEVTPAVRALINRKALEEEIRETVRAEGFRTLYHDGLEKVAQGSVSLEEVQRVCKTI